MAKSESMRKGMETNPARAVCDSYKTVVGCKKSRVTGVFTPIAESGDTIEFSFGGHDDR